MLKKTGIEIISITDHNTAKVYEALEKVDINKYYNGKIIAGIELNTKILGIPIEILGYGINYKKINEDLKRVYLSSEERNIKEAERLYEKCLQTGIRLEDGCLKNYVPTSFASKFIQSEIKKFEENKNIISEDALNDIRIFYRKYMSNPEGPLYVEMDDLVPDFEVATKLIKVAGRTCFYSSHLRIQGKLKKDFKIYIRAL